MAKLAHYTFFSWLRRGISAHQKLVGSRATVKIDVTTDGATKHVDLELFGPADIFGFDGRAVIRVWPQPGARDAEPNYFPLIEFSQPDLPWRFTPATATGDRLSPWLCLVVLKADRTANEILDYFPASATRSSAILRARVAALPDLNQSWGWAHTQRDGTSVANDADLAMRLTAEPSKFLSRILSTSRMVADTEYRAFLVPAFEGNRLAGLGQEVANPLGQEVANPLDLAWTSAMTEILLPVYFEWGFHTGPEGDFAALVRKIRPNSLPEIAGFRDMDVSQPPGMGLPKAFDDPLRQDGALIATTSQPTNWIGAVRDAFVTGLRKLLNLPEELKRSGAENPAVAPPLYGRWPARQTENTASSPSWFQRLNDDPRRRVAAGAGAEVIRRDQQALLAAAWDQAPSLRQAQDALRNSQFGAEILVRIKDRLFVTEPDALLRLTAPLHAKVLQGAKSIRWALMESPIAESIFEPQFRRLTRALGPVGRRQARTSKPLSKILDRMNRGTFVPAPPPATSDELPTNEKLGTLLLPSWATPSVIALLNQLPFWLVVVGILAALLGLIIPGGLWLVLVGAASAASAPLVRRVARDLSARAAARDGTLTAEQVRQVRFPSGYFPTELEPGVWKPVKVKTAPGTEAVATENFRTAAAAVFAELSKPIAEPRALRQVSMPAISQTLEAKLDPRLTVAEAIHQRLNIPPHAFQPGQNPAAPVVLAPQFDNEMYSPLRAISQEWILPGIKEVKPNSSALVETNQDFIEAYMVGVNHEMARTLLFNEYPADLRATYFRQFWRSAGTFGASTSPEELRDIKPIASWPDASDLGAHTARRRAKHLVLMVRGEVLRRYPNTIVYAAPAIRDSQGKRVLDSDESKYLGYVFYGDLAPDIRFFGFELTKEQAKGGQGNEGWFFVLQQHPQEPLFGLEANAAVAPPATFKELAWSQVVVQPGPATETRHINLSATTKVINDLVAKQVTGGPQWNLDAANFAASTLRMPVRVAFHASSMLKGL